MSMVPLLYRLQQTDSEIAAGKERLAEVIRAQHESEALKNTRRRAETAAAGLQKLQTSQLDLNLELESLNDKVRRSEQRLYSGDVTNPKELEDLQHELESLGRRRSALEDELLEVMIQVEDIEQEHEEVEAELLQLTTLRQASLGQLRQEQAELAQQLYRLDLVRQEQASRVDPGILADYDHLRQRKGGQAVALLSGDRCSACHLTQSSYTIREVREGNFVYCGSCGRILTIL